MRVRAEISTRQGSASSADHGVDAKCLPAVVEILGEDQPPSVGIHARAIDRELQLPCYCRRRSCGYAATLTIVSVQATGEVAQN